MYTFMQTLARNTFLKNTNISLKANNRQDDVSLMEIFNDYFKKR